MVKNVSSVNLIRKTLTPKRKPYSFAQDLINKSGTFTKEDLSRVKLMQINYSSLSEKEIKEKLIALKTSINDMLQKFFLKLILF